MYPAMTNALSETQVLNLERTTAVLASISLVAVILMFIDIYICWPRIKRSPSRIVLWWTLATSLSIPGMIVGRTAAKSWITCQAQGALLTYSIVSSAFWACCIATNMSLAILYEFKLHQIMKIEPVYHFLAWGVPAIAAAVPLFLHHGHSIYVTGCWISNSYSILQLISLPIASWVCFLYSFIVYAVVGIKIQSIFKRTSRIQGTPGLLQKRQSQATHKFILKSSLYLVAFFSSHIGSTVNYMYSYVTGQVSMPLMFLQAITLPAAGLVNTIIYFMSRSVKPAPQRLSPRPTLNDRPLDSPVRASFGSFNSITPSHFNFQNHQSLRTPRPTPTPLVSPSASALFFETKHLPGLPPPPTTYGNNP